MSILPRAFLTVTLVSPIASLPAAPDFEKEIWPILDSKCLSCHHAPKVEDGKKKDPKAGLRLDAAWAILKGSEDGPVLKPGDSAKSDLYVVTTLPKDDDMFMPPKGDPLTAPEMALLKAWIDAGADFGTWQGNLEGKPEDADTTKVAQARDHETFYANLAKGVTAASDEAIKKAKDAGAQVFLLKADEALLRVDFLTSVSACTDEKLEILLPLKDQIAQLDLGRTEITDKGLAVISQLQRLASLDLRQTAVTDAGLEKLASLKNLRTLNLYGTQVSDAGLKHLRAHKNLKNVYLWQTKATTAGANQLAAAIPGLQVSIK